MRALLSSPTRPLSLRHRASRARRVRLEHLEGRELLTAVAVPSGIVSWWTANSTAADAMGLNNATLSNVTYSSGEVGKAFSFNGLNGWAALGDPKQVGKLNLTFFPEPEILGQYAGFQHGFLRGQSLNVP